MNSSIVTVSVIMPVYNCASTVGEAVASIVAQTFHDWEMVIIDDGSTDHTLEVLRGFSDSRIRIIEGKINKHLPSRLNEAVALARGKFIARMDGDDVSYPDRLRLQLDCLNENPDVDLLGGSILIFDSRCQATGVRRAQQSHKDILGKPWRRSTLAHVTWIGKREWFERNPYNERLTHAQDRELLTRTRFRSQFAAIPEIVVGVRESYVNIKKQIPARKQLFKTFLREGIRQRSASMALISAPLELIKLGFDLTAIKSGLSYRMLSHRVPYVDPAEAQRWTELLDHVRRSVPQYSMGERQ